MKVEKEYYVIRAAMPNVSENLGYLRMLRNFETDRLSFTFDFGRAMRFETKETARDYFESFGAKLEYEVLKVTITTEKMVN